MEWILRPISTSDAGRWADRLIGKFGSLSSVLAADVAATKTLLDDHLAPAHHLRQFREVMSHAAKSEFQTGSVFQQWGQLIDYLKLEMSLLRVEQMRAIFLNSAHALIGDEILATGTLNEVPCYPRQVARQAVLLDAAGVLLVHNHPSGDTRMSGADRTITFAVDEACRAVGVRLHDHLVICSGGYSSFRHDNPLWARTA